MSSMQPRVNLAGQSFLYSGSSKTCRVVLTDSTSEAKTSYKKVSQQLPRQAWLALLLEGKASQTLVPVQLTGQAWYCIVTIPMKTWLLSRSTVDSSACSLDDGDLPSGGCSSSRHMESVLM